MQNNDNLDMLYTIINNLQKVHAPIAIKGGLLLKASLQEHKSRIDRKTIDIDGNWLNKQPDMEDMRETIEQAVQMTYPTYNVYAKRNFDEKQSAGFYIVDEDEVLVTKMDIDVNKPTITAPYSINGIKFQGIPMEQVLCDKISVLSSPRMMRRTKDLLDVYAITKDVPYDKQTVIELLSRRDLGDFSTLQTRKEEISHAYDKLRDVTNKPDFNTVYDTVSTYCTDISKEVKNTRRQRRTNQTESQFGTVCEKAEQKALGDPDNPFGK